jgi:hypothetical protein
MALSTQDLATIVEAVKTAGHHEFCRFGDIEPGDLKAMVDAHKRFDAAMTDSKTVVRRFFIFLVLTGASGFAVIGWWSEVVDKVKKAIAGGS